ncbi:hypothetical protein [Gudongella sp. SC589]|jgi:hypothetical protein|uniref:hypothetical protein n=1 Tax=Gudongella sp. SC589 TaxID=3385990 RepID=UPI0039049DDE
MSGANDQRYMEKLLDKYDRLRKKTAKAIKKRDRMSYHTYVDYKTKYVMEVGSLEYEFLKVENNLLRMRRKIEIIHNLMDNDEKVDISLIEHMLDREFEENELKLKNMEKDIEIANILKADKRLSLKEERDLDRIYEGMILELHPDINSEVSSDQGLDWEKIVWTYETSDLATMRSLKEVLEKGIPSYGLQEVGFYRLEDRVKALSETLGRVESEIEEMSTNFPFDMVDLLKDREWLEEKKEELRENTEIYREVEEELGNYILKILPQSAIFKN